MPQNPMLEILLEKAVNTLSKCEDYLDEETFTETTPEKFKRINDLRQEIQKIIKQADTLNL
jgi:transcription initiation factor IIE alpha subunit